MFGKIITIGRICLKKKGNSEEKNHIKIRLEIKNLHCGSFSIISYKLRVTTTMTTDSSHNMTGKIKRSHSYMYGIFLKHNCKYVMCQELFFIIKSI